MVKTTTEIYFPPSPGTMMVISSGCPREEEGVLLQLGASCIHSFIHSFTAMALGAPTQREAVMAYLCYASPEQEQGGLPVFSLNRRPVHFLCPGLPCRLCVLCHNQSTLPSWPEGSHGQYVNKWRGHVLIKLYLQEQMPRCGPGLVCSPTRLSALVYLCQLSNGLFLPRPSAVGVDSDLPGQV